MRTEPVPFIFFPVGGCWQRPFHLCAPLQRDSAAPSMEMHLFLQPRGWACLQRALVTGILVNVTQAEAWHVLVLWGLPFLPAPRPPGKGARVASLRMRDRKNLANSWHQCKDRTERPLGPSIPNRSTNNEASRMTPGETSSRTTS